MPPITISADRRTIPILGVLRDFDEPGHIKIVFNLRYADGWIT